MNDYLNEEIIVFKNDVSSSSFGWNFQSSAGMILFMENIERAKEIKMESKLQDIEIILRDDTKILAQAKSAQDYSACKDKKEKFKDAIISLAKCSGSGKELVYISNIPETFETAKRDFDNILRCYDDLLQSTKDEIDGLFSSTIKSIEAKIENVKTKADTKKKSRKIVKLLRLSKI